MGFAAGDTNISRYVGNSTPNGTDPTGLQDGLEVRLRIENRLALEELEIAERNRLTRRHPPILVPNGIVDPARNGTVYMTEFSYGEELRWRQYRPEYDTRTHQQLVDEVMRHRPGLSTTLFQTDQCIKYIDQWRGNLINEPLWPRVITRTEFVRYNFDPALANWYDVYVQSRATTGHATAQIYLIDGTIIQVDNGAFGGSNHIIETGEIPPCAYTSDIPLPTIFDRDFYNSIFPRCLGGF